jgi:hypothetical protein
MNKLLTLSTTALLLSGLALSGTAFAAAVKAPTLRTDSGSTDTATPVDVQVDANDKDDDNTITGYTGGKAKYGTVSCDTGVCTYTPNPSKAKGKKTDSFTYTVTYKDARGKTRTKSARVTIHLKPPSVSGAAV